MTDPARLIEGWPALMSTEVAARYVSLEEAMLIKLASDYDVPFVEIENQPACWRKQDLDRLIKKLPAASSKLLLDQPVRMIRLEHSQIESIADAVAKRLGREGAKSESKLVSINEASAILGIGRTTIYRMIGDGTLETRRIGRRTLILRADLEAILEGSEEN